MRHLDLFSGYLGFSEAMRSVDSDYELVLACEIERNCQHVIRRHRPGVKIAQDIKDLDGRPYADTVDVLTFGSPCQDLSVAGKREGLDGNRSGLFFDAVRLIKEVRPRFFIFENVPGLLSSQCGRDMGIAVREFQKLGDYTCAWRSLDLQYFGCPQRRERIFAVGSLGNASCIEILFESESLRRNPEKGDKTGAGVAGTFKSRSRSGGWHTDVEMAGGNRTGGHRPPGTDVDTAESLQVVCRNSGQGFWSEDENASTLGSGPRAVHEGTLVSFNWQDSHNFTISEQTNNPLRANQTEAIAFTQNQCGDVLTGETMHAISTNQNATGRNSAKVQTGMQVRRLTPTECERLQGLPDSWTAWGIDENGKRVEISDSARYRMIGNGVGLPVVAWIGKRINRTRRPTLTAGE